MNKFIWIALLLCLSPATPWANGEVQPIIYNREVIRLIPKPEAKILPSALPSALPAPKPVKVEAAEEKDKKKNQLSTKADNAKQEELKVTKVAAPEGEEQPAPPPPRVPIDFTVDIKTPDFLAQDDFITHTAFATHQGLLILIDPVAITELTATRMVGLSDVLFINEDGLIIKIAPSLNLGQLNEAISSGSPIRAFLFIAPGSAEAERITLGDRFENAIFKTHPVILQ